MIRSIKPIHRKVFLALLSIVLVSSPLALFCASVLAQDATTQRSPSITNLQPPFVSDYWVSATRQASGAIIFDGYVPDTELQARLATHSQANVQWLKLGSGAPQQYMAAIEFGLSLLDQLSEGRFGLHDNVVTITGTAKSARDYAAVLTRLQDAAPTGLVLARSEIIAPVAASYQWFAKKCSAGAITLGGLTPDPTTEALLLAAAGSNATGTMTYASGQPDDLVKFASLGIEMLQRVDEGRIAFDGFGWVFTGMASKPEDKAQLETNFAAQQLAAAGWSMAIAQAPLGAHSITNQVDPLYSLSVIKPSTGTMIFIGKLPADPALRFFGAITNGDTTAVTISSGAPDNFIPQAEAGTRALMRLDEGSLPFAKGKWTLTGTVQDAASRDDILLALRAIGSADWQTAIDLPANLAPAPPAIVVATAGATPATTSATCADSLAAFSDRNAILFRPGAAIITIDSAPALDELAADLSNCPDATIHVEGHTDADGDDRLNLALSVARAEAVISALVERGIKSNRLYALGYGETSPIGDNKTAEGKQMNRRIVVKVSSDL
jgi:outer membrane protein OmpA-like peptidoglycan-associated protein